MDKDKILEMINDHITEDNKKGSHKYEDIAFLHKYWEELVSEFRKGSMEEIIEFLDSMPDKQLEYASEVFEDIYEDLDEHEKFCDELEKLEKRRPTANLN